MCSTFPFCISWEKLNGDLFNTIIMSCNLFSVNGIALKAYVSIRSVMWTAKTKFLFFCWLSFYIIWNPISVLKLLYFSRFIPKQITEIINIHWYWYLYRNCWSLSQAIAESEYTKRERLAKFYSFTRLTRNTRLLFGWRQLLINLKGFRTTLWKMKKM